MIAAALFFFFTLVSLTNGQTATSLSVYTAPASPSVFQNVIFISQITPNVGTNTPTSGVLVLRESGIIILQASADPIWDGEAVAISGPFSLGSHTVGVEFISTDPLFVGSSTTVTFTVTKASTITDFPDYNGLVGDTITLFATVTPNAGTVSGSVSFLDENGNLILDGSTNPAPIDPLYGFAQFSKIFPEGSTNVKARYEGNSNFITSEDWSTITISQPNTCSWSSSDSLPHIYNFASLSTPTGVSFPQPPSENPIFESYFSYYWTLCQDVNQPNPWCPIGHVAYQIGQEYCFGLGKPQYESHQFLTDINDGSEYQRVTYLGGDNGRSVSIDLRCSFYTSTNFISENGETGLINLGWKTPLACKIPPTAIDIPDYSVLPQQPVTLSATVIAQDTIPQGSVVFLNSNNEPLNIVGNPATLNGAGVATLQVNFAVGVYVITAKYLENIALNLGSSSDISTVTVGVSTTLDFPDSIAITNQPTTLSVRVTASNGQIPTGSVTFYENDIPLTGSNNNPAPLNNNGIAIFTTTLTKGLHNLRAVYGGGGDFSGSEDDATVTVATAIACGQALDGVISYELERAYFSLTTAANHVRVSATTCDPLTTMSDTKIGFDNNENDDSYENCADNGLLSYISVDNPTPGVHTLWVSAYGSETGNFRIRVICEVPTPEPTPSPTTPSPTTPSPTTPSPSSTSTPSVPKPVGTKTTLAPKKTTIGFGQQATLTINVDAIRSSKIPQGSIFLYDSDLNLLGNSQPLNSNGKTTILLNGLRVDTHKIRAVFRPTNSSQFTCSISKAVTIKVEKAGTSTFLYSFPNPSEVNHPVLFTVNVRTKTNSNGTPTGQVKLYDNNILFKTINLINGWGLYSHSNFGRGLHSISARYSGDDHFQNSKTAKALKQRVLRNGHE